MNDLQFTGGCLWRRLLYRSRLLLGLCLVHSAMSCWSSELTQRMQALLGTNEAAQAFALGQENEVSAAGDPAFDFTYGLAAVAVGRLNEAMFAFERVLMVQPDNDRCRLELARTYYRQEDYLSARQEFNTVLARNPPDNVKQHIEKYLLVIEEKLERLRWDTAASVSVSLGHDTNVNSGTQDSIINVPTLNQVTLDPNATETDDQFMQVGAAGRLLYKQNRQAAWLAEFNVSQRDNTSAGRLNTTTIGGQTGPQWRWGAGAWSVPLTAQRLNLHGSALRNLGAVGVNWTQTGERALPWSAYGQTGAIRYPDQPTSDVDYWLGGVALTRAGAISLNGGIYYGDEDAKTAGATSQGRRYWGARVEAQRPLAAGLLVRVGATGQSVEHAARDTVFLATRRDNFAQVSAALKGTVTRDLRWSVNVDALLNDSNIALYEYDRTIIAGGVEYAW